MELVSICYLIFGHDDEASVKCFVQLSFQDGYVWLFNRIHQYLGLVEQYAGRPKLGMEAYLLAYHFAAKSPTLTAIDTAHSNITG